MAFFKKDKAKAIFDVIRCDETDYLIWKWHPTNTDLGQTTRENAIRWNSSLRVKDGEVAVFVYNQKGRLLQDFIIGPFDQKLKTANLPILSGIIGLAYKGESPFQAEVYFINLAQVIQVKFGVPYFDVYDPRFADFGVPVAVRGTITFQISDYDKFIRLHRLDTFDLAKFQAQIKDAVCRYVKDEVTNAPAAHNIPVVQIESRTAIINDNIELNVSYRLKEHFGVDVSGVDISAIEIDKTSESYRQLMAITADVTSQTIQAQAAANIENYTEGLRIQREEAQYAQHMQTQSANMGAFQVAKQAEVGIASAEAFGKFGEAGTGGVELEGGTGFNPVAMMAGMALGSMVGQNITGAMNTAMSGVATPPPIPQAGYFVATNGAATGPFDMTTLQQMIATGQLTRTTLVWKNGMPNWVAAETVAELAPLFANVPPVPPTI